MDKPCFKTKIFLLCFRFAFVQMMYITFKILLLVYWQKLYFLKSFLMTFRKTLSSSSICNTQTFVIIFYHPHVRLESQSFFFHSFKQIMSMGRGIDFPSLVQSMNARWPNLRQIQANWVLIFLSAS